MVLTKEEIRDRIRIYDVWVTTARTDLLGGAVDEAVLRNVIMINLSGDLQQNRAVDIEKLDEEGNYVLKFSRIPVAPADFRQIPLNYDIEQPLISMEGGSSLYGTVTGNSLQAMVHYWDE